MLFLTVIPWLREATGTNSSGLGGIKPETCSQIVFWGMLEKHTTTDDRQMRALTELDLATFCAFRAGLPSQSRCPLFGGATTPTPGRWRAQIPTEQPVTEVAVHPALPENVPDVCRVGRHLWLAKLQTLRARPPLGSGPGAHLARPGPTAGAGHQLAGPDTGPLCRRAHALARRHRTALPPGARRRVTVEHAISGAKRLGCVTHVYRSKSRTFNGRVTPLACGIWNWQLTKKKEAI